MKILGGLVAVVVVVQGKDIWLAKCEGSRGSLEWDRDTLEQIENGEFTYKTLVDRISSGPIVRTHNSENLWLGNGKSLALTGNHVYKTCRMGKSSTLTLRNGSSIECETFETQDKSAIRFSNSLLSVTRGFMSKGRVHFSVPKGLTAKLDGEYFLLQNAEMSGSFQIQKQSRLTVFGNVVFGDGIHVACEDTRACVGIRGMQRMTFQGAGSMLVPIISEGTLSMTAHNKIVSFDGVVESSGCIDIRRGVTLVANSRFSSTGSVRVQESTVRFNQQTLLLGGVVNTGTIEIERYENLFLGDYTGVSGVLNVYGSLFVGGVVEAGIIHTATDAIVFVGRNDDVNLAYLHERHAGNFVRFASAYSQTTETPAVILEADVTGENTAGNTLYDLVSKASGTRNLADNVVLYAGGVEIERTDATIKLDTLATISVVPKKGRNTLSSSQIMSLFLQTKQAQLRMRTGDLSLKWSKYNLDQVHVAGTSRLSIACKKLANITSLELNGTLTIAKKRNFVVKSMTGLGTLENHGSFTCANRCESKTTQNHREGDFVGENFVVHSQLTTTSSFKCNSLVLNNNTALKIQGGSFDVSNTWLVGSSNIHVDSSPKDDVFFDSIFGNERAPDSKASFTVSSTSQVTVRTHLGAEYLDVHVEGALQVLQSHSVNRKLAEPFDIGAITLRSINASGGSLETHSRDMRLQRLILTSDSKMVTYVQDQLILDYFYMDGEATKFDVFGLFVMFGNADLVAGRLYAHSVLNYNGTLDIGCHVDLPIKSYTQEVGSLQFHLCEKRPDYGRGILYSESVTIQGGQVNLVIPENASKTHHVFQAIYTNLDAFYTPRGYEAIDLHVKTTSGLYATSQVMNPYLWNGQLSTTLQINVFA
uniref:Uncharacterized protein n=1 Tax=Mucochytrium quahogii TaxID=96639 RepID=A0A7S2WBC9_9STRA|mmetsp:Transcript_18731/g.40566  ORF Transcript_18731/g.40566 Transcript_18731/m.40566 type:complete len:874 (+) Transcript_18731:152-2773(+)